MPRLVIELEVEDIESDDVQVLLHHAVIVSSEEPPQVQYWDRDDSTRSATQSILWGTGPRHDQIRFVTEEEAKALDALMVGCD